MSYTILLEFEDKKEYRRGFLDLSQIYIIKSGVCVFVCQHFNVQLTSPPVLKLWDTQGYLWLSAPQFFFSKKYFMSFLPHYFHTFHTTVIPSRLLSFLLYYCHSFRIIVIPSKLFRELQILTSSKSFPYPKGEKNGHRRWPYMRVFVKKSTVPLSLA